MTTINHLIGAMVTVLLCHRAAMTTDVVRDAVLVLGVMLRVVVILVLVVWVIIVETGRHGLPVNVIPNREPRPVWTKPGRCVWTKTRPVLAIPSSSSSSSAASAASG